jgi:hypothetical protein
MIKYIIFAIILNLALVVSNLTSQDVLLDIKSPSVVEAGTTVVVEIELHKNQLTGFARFLQVLPYGITASPVYPADMNFSFEDNTVKMIWLNLPPDESLTIRYQLHINERLKGNLQLDGQFSYIENNQRMTVAASGTLLAINPSPSVEERYLVDVSEANQKLLAPAPTAGLSRDVLAIRQTPVAVNGNGYIVSILVNKEGNKHFAKIEELVPDGYTAAEVESMGGIFSFSDQKARIIWRNLPMQPDFIVSYRLIARDENAGIPDLKGEFSFMQNEITASRVIVQRDTDLRALTENEKRNLIASVPFERPSPATAQAARTPLVAGTVGTPARVTPVAGERRRPSLRPGTEITKPLESESGVYYRVQLAAGHRPVDIERYFSRLNITDDVRSEIHDGWIKYSIGSYYNYRTARDYRVHIWNTTPITDAFVAAYNEGERITVQEALMIANHQWYR